MRSLTALIRDELEASQTGDFPIVLATIDHEAFISPFRFSTDNHDFTYDGELYFGWSLDITLPGDTDDPGQGSISIQNVDEQVASVLQDIATPLTIDLKVLWRSDFISDISVSTPSLWWRRALYMTNVSIADELITGTISGDDLVTEPWPYHRAIRSLLPALYR